MDAERYDAFVSYAHRDATWVQVLAEHLDLDSVENVINALPDPDDP